MLLDWESHVGVVTGIIGSATGITGAVMGFIAYRRSKATKTSDLRLELHKARNIAELSSNSLNTLLVNALRSRRAVLSARGLSSSGGMIKYEDAHKTDSEHASSLAAEIAPSDVDYELLSEEELRHATVALHMTQCRIDELIKKYHASVGQDDIWRSEIAASRLSSPPNRKSSYEK